MKNLLSPGIWTNLKSPCLILLFLVAANYTKGQIPQYYNYNISVGQNSFPFNISTGKMVQLLYLPGDFKQPSPACKGYITSISFRMNDTYSLGPWTYTNFIIKLGQTGITSFTPGSFYPGSLDTVYFRASVSLAAAAGQWMTIPLDTLFYYDPGQSLVVDVSQCGIPAGASGYSMCKSTLPDYRRIWSTGGFPFVPNAGSDGGVYHLGLNICPHPPAPENTTPVANQKICSGNAASLNATGSGTLGWYSKATGGTYLGGGTSFNTPELTTDSTFYVQDSTCLASESRTAIQVSVHPVYSFMDSDTICDGQSYVWHGQNLTSEGIYHDNYTTINGCDSIYELSLTVHPSYSFNEIHSVCNGQTYAWHGQYLTTEGTYYDSHYSINGCDSIYSLILTVNPAYSFNQSHSMCEGEIYNWQGADYTVSGTYIANYSGITGCDSSYILNLIVNILDISVSVEDHIITSNMGGASYQWINCDNDFEPITGANSQSYTPLTDGNYAVLVTQGLCTDTSRCVALITTGVPEITGEEIIIFPNPVSDELIIETNGINKYTHIEIINSFGQVVFKGELTDKTVVNTSGFTSGMYLIKFDSRKFSEYRKIVKD